MAEQRGEPLGQFVQRLRKLRGMTQDELGALAGYGTGAAVSISRFENGQMTPGPEKLRGIAQALGIAPEDLQDRPDQRSSRPPSAGSNEGPKNRAKRIEGEVAARAGDLAKADASFKAAQEKVTSDFLTRLADVGARIEGARPVGSAHPSGGGRVADPRARSDQADPEPGVPDAVVSAVGLGVALSLLRGVRGLPVGGLALPVIAAVAETVVSEVLRARRQQQERTSRADHAEKDLADTAPRFFALINLLSRATVILEYVAVHAGHALERWDRRLGNPPPAWADLETADQERFAGFLEIAAAVIDVYRIEFDELATLDADLLSRQIASIENLLTRADGVVKSRV